MTGFLLFVSRALELAGKLRQGPQLPFSCINRKISASFVESKPKASCLHSAKDILVVVTVASKINSSSHHPIDEVSFRALYR